MSEHPNPTDRRPSDHAARVVRLLLDDQEAAYLVDLMEHEAEHWHDRAGAYQGTPADLAAAVRCERLATYIHAERGQGVAS
jgi:hypothetical protein